MHLRVLGDRRRGFHRCGGSVRQGAGPWRKDSHRRSCNLSLRCQAGRHVHRRRRLPCSWIRHCKSKRTVDNVWVLPFGIVKCAFGQRDKGFSKSLWERATAEADGEHIVPVEGAFVGLLNEVCEADGDVIC